MKTLKKEPIGVTRKIDPLGRVVLPMEVRRKLNIANGDPLEIFVTEDSIVFKRYSRGCVICDSLEELNEYKEKIICNSCINGIKKARPVYY
jgi:transcriptional pleiotropic regulator of transition state genes